MIQKKSIKLGIIGGAGPLASCVLYKMLIEKAQKDYKSHNDCDFPEIIIINFPFSMMLSQNDSSKNSMRLIDELQHCFNQLTQTQVTHAIIACNTLHAFVSSIDMKNINFISLIDETKKITMHYKSVVSLQTETAQQSKLYGDLISPNKDVQQKTSAIINAILQGDITEKYAHKLAECIKQNSDIVSRDAVVLGCTELSVINNYFPLKKYLFTEKIFIIDPLEIVTSVILRLIYS